jgi:hypothetical protein
VSWRIFDFSLKIHRKPEKDCPRNLEKIGVVPFSIEIERLEHPCESRTTLPTILEQTDLAGCLRNLGGRRGQLTLEVGARGAVTLPGVLQTVWDWKDSRFDLGSVDDRFVLWFKRIVWAREST